MAILVLDSGLGGLTVLREVRAVMPTQQIIYVGDDDGFPYGNWSDQALIERLVGLFTHYLKAHTIELAIVACNTASTLIMPSLRSTFDIPFVGVVPAIKPAVERTVSGLVSVLATPGTISRRYTQTLIDEFAGDVKVNLVASADLANLAEHYIQHREIDTGLLWREIEPCFVDQDGKRTDIVVLGCTHYPFVVNEMRKIAPWPVDWIDPSEAVALQALEISEKEISEKIWGSTVADNSSSGEAVSDLAYLTSNVSNSAAERLLRGFGLQLRKSVAIGLRAADQR